jgi:hypothetical protein
MIRAIRRRIVMLLEGIVLIPHFLEATLERRTHVVELKAVLDESNSPGEGDKQEIWQITICTVRHPAAMWLGFLWRDSDLRDCWVDRRFPESVERVFVGKGSWWFEVRNGHSYGPGKWMPIINALVCETTRSQTEPRWYCEAA